MAHPGLIWPVPAGTPITDQPSDEAADRDHDLTPARFGHWELDSALVPAAYVQAVQAAGGRPLLIPPEDDGIDETLDALDGLLFSGGSDLDPELYGQEAHDETHGVAPDRDRAELALLTAALERDMPVLAVCRGSQILNVARGGDLVQHLPDVVGDEKHKHTPGVFSDHDVDVEPKAASASSSATARRSSRTTTRASGSLERVFARRPGPKTGRSKGSKTRRGDSRSESCGIRRPARISPCSTRSSRKRASTGSRSAPVDEARASPGASRRQAACQRRSHNGDVADRARRRTSSMARALSRWHRS